VFVPEIGDEVDYPAFPRLKAEDISLNIKLEAMPHVVGAINRAPFRDSAFEEVYFEKVPYEAFTGDNLGAIIEVVRVLAPEGRLVIETGRDVPISQVVAAMRRAGFKYIRITDKKFIRISGRLRGE
jgi:hypothetical protein